MAIILITGEIGAGKTSNVMQDMVLPAISSGRHVVTNITINDKHRANLDKDYPAGVDYLHVLDRFARPPAFGRYDDFKRYLDPQYRSDISEEKRAANPDLAGSGPLYVIDEAHTVFPSAAKPMWLSARPNKDDPTHDPNNYIDILAFISQSRQAGADIVFIVQSEKLLDPLFLALVTNHYHYWPATDTLGKNWFGVTKYLGVKATGNDPEGRIKPRRRKPEVFNYYETHSLSGGLALAEGKAITVRRLWQRPQFILAAIAIPFIIFGIFFAFNNISNFGAPVSSDPSSPTTSIVSPGPIAVGPSGAPVVDITQATRSRVEAQDIVDYRPLVSAHPLANHGLRLVSLNPVVIGGRLMSIDPKVAWKGQRPVPVWSLQSLGYDVQQYDCCSVQVSYGPWTTTYRTSGFGIVVSDRGAQRQATSPTGSGSIPMPDALRQSSSPVQTNAPSQFVNSPAPPGDEAVRPVQR